MEEPNLRLLLFDLDGTLVSLKFPADDLRMKLNQFFMEQYGLDIYFKPVLQKIDEAERKIQRSHGVEEAQKARSRAWEMLIESELQALNGSEKLPFAHELLSLLRAKKFKLGVFSRTTKEVVEKSIEKHGLGSFDVVVSREDTVETKPSPEPVLKCLELTGESPGSTVVVGDHPYDMISGKKAGTMAAGVLTGLGSEVDLKKSGADFIFKDLQELYNKLF